MNVRVEDFPTNFQPIIRRLQGAVEKKEVRDTMMVEDDFFNEIMEYEQRVELVEKRLKYEKKRADDALLKQESAERMQKSVGKN